MIGVLLSVGLLLGSVAYRVSLYYLPTEKTEVRNLLIAISYGVLGISLVDLTLATLILIQK